MTESERAHQIASINAMYLWRECREHMAQARNMKRQGDTRYTEWVNYARWCNRHACRWHQLAVQALQGDTN